MTKKSRCFRWKQNLQARNNKMRSWIQQARSKKQKPKSGQDKDADSNSDDPKVGQFKTESVLRILACFDMSRMWLVAQQFDSKCYWRTTERKSRMALPIVWSTCIRYSPLWNMHLEIRSSWISRQRWWLPLKKSQISESLPFLLCLFSKLSSFRCRSTNWTEVVNLW